MELAAAEMEHDRRATVGFCIPIAKRNRWLSEPARCGGPFSTTGRRRRAGAPSVGITADLPRLVAHSVSARFSRSRGPCGHPAADPRQHECGAGTRNRRRPC